jgi:hypothetical protein
MLRLLLFTPALPMQALQACNLTSTGAISKSGNFLTVVLIVQDRSRHREFVNSESRASSDWFQFHKRSQLFIGADDEALSVVAMRISGRSFFR